MLNVEKLMSLTEMAHGQADGLSASDNIYSNISLDEAVMIGQVQLLESNIEYHDIMDEDANDSMDIFINQLQGNIMTEAANNAKRNGFVEWINKIRKWIVDKFNKFIQWVKGLASKIKGLFTKKSNQAKTASAKLEDAQKKVAAASTKSAAVAKAVKEVEKEEATFNMSYVDGYAIKSIDALSDAIKSLDLDTIEASNKKLSLSNLLSAINEKAAEGSSDSEMDRMIEYLNDSMGDDAFLPMLTFANQKLIDSYNFKDKPANINEFLKDLSGKRTQKACKLSELGFNPVTDSVDKKFAGIISQLSGVKCEINFSDPGKIQKIIADLNSIAKRSDEMKKSYDGRCNAIQKAIVSNPNISDKAIGLAKAYLNKDMKWVSDTLAVANKFAGTSAQILSGYYDSCIAITAACISKLGKVVSKVKEEKKDGTKTTNIEYSNKPANQSNKEADVKVVKGDNDEVYAYDYAPEAVSELY